MSMWPTKSVADVIRDDEAQPMPMEDFDDALWHASLDAVKLAEDFHALPGGFRMYFATRMVEWEVGSGGFVEAVECAAAYWDEAIAGYRLLGDESSAELLARCKGLDEKALETMDAVVAGPPWNGVPWSDSKRIEYVRAHRAEFRAIGA